MSPDEPDAPTTPEEVATGNPLGDALSFDLSMPTIKVRMVDAAGLEEYEVWFGFSSTFAATVVGFMVAYMQSFREDTRHVEHSQPLYLIVALIFLGFLLAAASRAWVLRRRLRNESRTYAMRAVSGPVTPPE